MKACHRCKTVWEEQGQPGFNNGCARCGMPLHSCMNCTHFVAKGSVRCLVESAEEVQDPSGGNRCAHFEFANAAAPAAALEAEAVANEFANRDVDDPATARKKWAELFGD